MNFGAIPSPTDVRDYYIKAGSKAEPLPDVYELPYKPDVKNQKSINSCVAHVAASIEEYFEYMQCAKQLELSPGFIYGTRYEYVGEGMYLRDALKTLQNKGICLQEKFPYNEEVPGIINRLSRTPITQEDTNHYKITSYFRCYNEQDIKQTIYNYGPVMACVEWFTDNGTVDGVLQLEGKSSGYHCIYLYGWNETGFLFQNSWGDWWGKEGRAILPYTYPITECYGITDTNIEIHGIDIVKPKRNKFLDFIYKLINWFLNLFRKDKK